jgi:hypothetical protein
MVMAPKGQESRNGDDQVLLSASKKNLTPKRPATTGPLQKFFAWIARGANQSPAGSRSCPT